MPDARPRLRVEADGRLVEEQNARIVDQRPWTRSCPVAIAARGSPTLDSRRMRLARASSQRASRAGSTTPRALVTDRVAPGVVYTTFHHPATQANVVTTEYSDWATNCPEYKVTAVEVSPSNGPSDWQRRYNNISKRNRRIRASTEGP